MRCAVDLSTSDERLITVVSSIARARFARSMTPDATSDQPATSSGVLAAMLRTR